MEGWRGGASGTVGELGREAGRHCGDHLLWAGHDV